MLNVVKKVLGSENDRKLKKLRPLVAKINALEPQFVALTDEQLKAKTGEFRKRLEDGETLDDLMIEAFATVREAAKRSLGQRPLMAKAFISSPSMTIWQNVTPNGWARSTASSV